MQQDQFTPEEQRRAERLAAPFKEIASIFAAAHAAAAKRDYIDDFSYEDAERKMLRDAARDEQRNERRGF